MEALIPKLFILTAEASIVLLLILIVMIIFNMKAKRKDLNAVNELVKDYTGNREERIASLKKQLTTISYSGNLDEQAEKLFQNEKSIIKEFVTLYLRRDTYRLLDYPEHLIDSNNIFLKTSGTGQATTVTQAPEVAVTPESQSEETANATILAREQAEANEAHLKELSELRLKNTELNEHLFEALETITSLMTEHGKKTGEEVDTNAQKVLEAIIYLRDNRLGKDNNPTALTPPADEHDQVNSFDLDSVDLAEPDATLDDSNSISLGIKDELNIDLDNLEEESLEKQSLEKQSTENDPATTTGDSNTINLEETKLDEDIPTLETEDTAEQTISEEADPWGDALAEQAASESEPEPESTEEADPWADALAEQATAETDATADATANDSTPAETAEESDPWAEALEEQATSEASSEATEPAEAEADPWADALAEQATAEATEEDDPWAAALAEQDQSEKK